jgi:hypothetical protein
MMSKIRFSAILPATCALLAYVVPSQAAVTTLIEDTFTGFSGAIGGRTPDTTFNDLKWITSAGSLVFNGNGNGGLDVSHAYSRTASFDLGTGYFAANPGIYELSVSITNASGINKEHWIGLALGTGDSSGNAAGGASAANYGAGPFLVYRLNSQVEVFAGPNNTNSLTTINTTTGQAHTFTIRLDTLTDATKWSFQVLLDGAAIDFGESDSFTYSSGNPDNLRYLMLSTGGSGSDASFAHIDNFNFVSVPEPGVSLLAGLSAISLFFRRRV